MEQAVAAVLDRHDAHLLQASVWTEERTAAGRPPHRTGGLAGDCHFILRFLLLEVGLRLQCRQNDGGCLLNHLKALG